MALDLVTTPTADLFRLNEGVGASVVICAKASRSFECWSPEGEGSVRNDFRRTSMFRGNWTFGLLVWRGSSC